MPKFYLSFLIQLICAAQLSHYKLILQIEVNPLYYFYHLIICKGYFKKIKTYL